MAARYPSLIGVIHLPPLAGSPGAHGLSPNDALAEAGARAVNEAKALTRAGFNGLIIENFGDAPFYKTAVPAETIASMSVIAAAVREVSSLPLGINVLRNDARSALAIAAVTGCEWIRVNVLSGIAATDQGLIEGDAAFLMRERARLGAEVQVMADVLVKHARTLSVDDVALAIEEVAGRGGANGVIVTGSTTGRAVDRERLALAAEAARHCEIPLWVGSGATPQNISELMKHASGVIVGSALRQGGQAGEPLDLRAVRALVKAFESSRKSSRKKR